MSKTTTIRDEFTALLARCSVEDKQALLAELARACFGLQPNAESVSITDEKGLVGYLIQPAFPQSAYDPMTEDPEFLAEILRRGENPEPCLSKEEVREMFGFGAGEDEFSSDEDEADGKGAA